MEIVKIEGTDCFTLPSGKYLPVTPWALDPDRKRLSQSAFDLCKMFVVKSEKEKREIYRKLDGVCVNLANEDEFIDFISIMLSIDVINNQFCSRSFKLNEEAGFSTYSCGYHGWLKEMHSYLPNGKTFLTLEAFKHQMLNYF